MQEIMKEPILVEFTHSYIINYGLSLKIVYTAKNLH